MAHQMCPVVVLVDVLFRPVLLRLVLQRLQASEGVWKRTSGRELSEFCAFGLCGQAPELFQQVKIRMEILYLAARLTLLNNS